MFAFLLRLFLQRNLKLLTAFALELQFLAMFVLTYMPVRFLFDFLRVADATYYGMTPAQYANIGLFILGLRLFMNVRKHPELLRPNGEVHIFVDGTAALVPEGKAKSGPKSSKPSKKSKKKR